MRIIFAAAKLGLICAATFCLLAWGAAAIEFNYALLQVDRATNSIAQDTHQTALAVQYRLDRMDAVIDSLNSAIRTHQAATVRASDDLHGSFQNANAVLIQLGLSADEVRLGSISQREALGKQNDELLGALGDLRDVFGDIRKQVNDPAIHLTLDNVNATTTDIRQSVNELTHPPKSTRGQRAMRFILQVIFGNAVQGAVRR